MLTEKTKEELIKIILDLDRENQELHEKIKAEQQKRNEKFCEAKCGEKVPDETETKSWACRNKAARA